MDSGSWFSVLLPHLWQTEHVTHTGGHGVGQDTCGLETTLWRNLQVPGSRSRLSASKAEHTGCPFPTFGHSWSNSHIAGPTFDEQRHNPELLTGQACQQLKRDVPWSAGHSGMRHQEWPRSRQGRAGIREVPWEGRMVMEEEGAEFLCRGRPSGWPIHPVFISLCPHLT